MVDYSRALPVGSVVLLKDADKRLMIIGYQRRKAGDETKIYDYCGCLYPEGFMGPESAAVFDHAQIDRVIAVGLQNQAQIAFAEKLKKVIASREEN